MTVDQFRALLAKPLWSKEVILWVAPNSTLRSLVMSENHIDLDLADLLPSSDDLPESTPERGEVLTERLDGWLRETADGISERTVLVVSGVPLLARYQVGLRPFYDWFARSRTLVVLQVDPPRRVPLPESVSTSVIIDPDSVVDYLRPLLVHPDKCVMETT